MNVHQIYLYVIVFLFIACCIIWVIGRRRLINICFENFNTDLETIRQYQSCAVKCPGCKSVVKTIIDFNNPENNQHQCKGCGTKFKIITNINVVTLTDFSMYDVPLEHEVQNFKHKTIDIKKS